MNSLDDSRTSPTLLSKLRSNPQDERAWREFERRYAEMIQQWCRRWGLQPSDAEDLTQDVLLAISKQMERFEYDPSRRFRSWLKTIAHRAWCDFLEKQRRRAIGSGETAVIRMLEDQNVEEEFSAQFELEWKRKLLSDAMKLVERRVQPHTWEAFRLLTQDGLSGAEVAKQLEMKVGAVWVAGSKVRKMIQQEVLRLEQLEELADESP